MNTAKQVQDCVHSTIKSAVNPGPELLKMAMSVAVNMIVCCFVAQALFDLQLSSIKHYTIGSFVPDVKVHFIVHRYAQLTASLLSLNAAYQVHPAPLLQPMALALQHTHPGCNLAFTMLVQLPVRTRLGHAK